MEAAYGYVKYRRGEKLGRKYEKYGIEHTEHEIVGLAKLWPEGWIRHLAKAHPSVTTAYCSATLTVLFPPVLGIGIVWTVTSIAHSPSRLYTKISRQT